MPPSSCPSARRGWIARPISCALVTRRTATSKLVRSTSTSTTVRGPGVGGVGLADVVHVVEALVRWVAETGAEEGVAARREMSVAGAAELPHAPGSAGFAAGLRGERPVERPRRVGDDPADDRHGARGDRRAAVRHQGRVGVERRDAIVGQPESLGHDLREDGARPLAHLRRRSPDADVPAREQLHGGDRGEADLAAAGEAGAVKVAGETEAAPLGGVLAVPRPVGPLRRRPLRPRQHGIESLTARAGVRHRLAGGGRAAILEQVPLAELDGIDADLRGDMVEVALEREGDLRHAEAAEGAVRRGVGLHDPAGDAQMVAAVRSRGVQHGAREHHGESVV